MDDGFVPDGFAPDESPVKPPQNPQNNDGFIADGFVPEKPVASGDMGTDLVKGVVVGTKGLIGSMGDLTRWGGDVLTETPGLNQLDVLKTGPALSAAGKKVSDFWKQSAAKDAPNITWANPFRKTAYLGGQAAPSIAAAFVPGAIATKVAHLGKVAGAVKLAQAAAATGEGVAATAALTKMAQAAGAAQKIGALTGAGALGLTAGAQKYSEAREAGLPLSKASLAGITSAAAQTVLEVQPLLKWLKSGNLSMFRRALNTAIQEGVIEEGSQQLVDNAISIVGWKGYSNLANDLFDGVVDSMVGGFVAGMGLGAFNPPSLDDHKQAFVDKAVKKGINRAEAEQQAESYIKRITTPLDINLAKLRELNAQQAEVPMVEGQKLVNTYDHETGTFKTTATDIASTRVVPEIRKRNILVLNSLEIPYEVESQNNKGKRVKETRTLPFTELPDMLREEALGEKELPTDPKELTSYLAKLLKGAMDRHEVYVQGGGDTQAGDLMVFYPELLLDPQPGNTYKQTVTSFAQNIRSEMARGIRVGKDKYPLIGVTGLNLDEARQTIMRELMSQQHKAVPSQGEATEAVSAEPEGLTAVAQNAIKEHGINTLKSQVAVPGALQNVQEQQVNNAFDEANAVEVDPMAAIKSVQESLPPGKNKDALKTMIEEKKITPWKPKTEVKPAVKGELSPEQVVKGALLTFFRDTSNLNEQQKMRLGRKDTKAKQVFAKKAVATATTEQQVADALRDALRETQTPYFKTADYQAPPAEQIEGNASPVEGVNISDIPQQHSGLNTQVPAPGAPMGEATPKTVLSKQSGNAVANEVRPSVDKSYRHDMTLPDRGHPQYKVNLTTLQRFINAFVNPESELSLMSRNIEIEYNETQKPISLSWLAKLLGGKGKVDKVIPVAYTMRGDKKVVIHSLLVDAIFKQYQQNQLVPLDKSYKAATIPAGLTLGEFRDFVKQHELAHAVTGLDGGVGDEIMANLIALAKIGRGDLMQQALQQLDDSLKVKETHTMPPEMKVVPMNMEMTAEQNTSGQATSTIEMSKTGQKSSTTRTTSIGGVGTLFAMSVKTGEETTVHPEIYRVTSMHTITNEDLQNPEWWDRMSRREGWSVATMKTMREYKAGNKVTYYERVSPLELSEQDITKAWIAWARNSFKKWRNLSDEEIYQRIFSPVDEKGQPSPSTFGIYAGFEKQMLDNGVFGSSENVGFEKPTGQVAYQSEEPRTVNEGGAVHTDPSSPAFHSEMLDEIGKFEYNREPLDVARDIVDARKMTNEIAKVAYNKAMSVLALFKESRGSYAQRTAENVAAGDVTIAIATNFNTGGEVLTRKLAEQQKKPYIPLDPKGANVDAIVETLNKAQAKTLNIAGNGIYSLRGLTQEKADKFLVDLLTAIIRHPNLQTRIERIVTGGQTGIDEAGAKAGLKLGIPTQVNAPKGWQFRDRTGKDISNESAFKSRFNDQEETYWKEFPFLRSLGQDYDYVQLMQDLEGYLKDHPDAPKELQTLYKDLQNAHNSLQSFSDARIAEILPLETRGEAYAAATKAQEYIKELTTGPYLEVVNRVREARIASGVVQSQEDKRTNLIQEEALRSENSRERKIRMLDEADEGLAVQRLLATQETDNSEYANEDQFNIDAKNNEQYVQNYIDAVKENEGESVPQGEDAFPFGFVQDKWAPMIGKLGQRLQAISTAYRKSFQYIKIHQDANKLINAARVDALSNDIVDMAMREMDLSEYAHIQGSRIRNGIWQAINEYVAATFPDADHNKQVDITNAYAMLLQFAAPEVGVGNNTGPMKFFKTLVGYGGKHYKGKYDPGDEKLGFILSYRQVRDKFSALGIPGFEYDPVVDVTTWEKNRPSMAYFGLLPKDMQSLLIWTKQNIELPALNAMISKGLLDRTDIFQKRINGWVHHFWMQENVPLNKWKTAIGSTDLSKQDFRTYDEFFYRTHHEKKLDKMGNRILPHANFADSMGHYATDSWQRTYQKHFIDKLRTLTGEADIPVVLYEHDIARFGRAIRMRLDRGIPIDVEDKIQVALQKNMKNDAEMASEHIQATLTDLGYNQMKSAPGLAEWNYGGFSDPWVHGSNVNLLSSLFSKPSADPMTQLWLKGTGALTQAILFSPWQVFPDQAFTSALWANNRKIPSLFGKHTLEIVGGWFPWITIPNAIKTGMDVKAGKYKQFGKIDEGVRKGFYDHEILDLAMQNGVVGIVPSSVMAEIFESDMMPNVMKKDKALLKEFVSSKFGLTYHANDLLTKGTYKMFESIFKGVYNSGQVSKDDAARIAAEFVETTSYMLSRKRFGQHRTLWKSISFGTDVMLGQFRILTGASYNMWQKAHKYRAEETYIKRKNVKEGDYSIVDTADILTRNIAKGFHNIVMHGTTSPADMRILQKYYMKHIPMILVNDIILINLVQMGLQLAFKAIAGIGGKDDDQETEDFFCMFNDPGHTFDIKTPWKDDLGNHIYIGLNAFREVEDVMNLMKSGLWDGYFKGHLRPGISQASEFLANKDIYGFKVHGIPGATLAENVGNTASWAMKSATPSFLKNKPRQGNELAQGLGKFFSVRTKAFGRGESADAENMFAPGELKDMSSVNKRAAYLDEQQKKLLLFKSNEQLARMVQEGKLDPGVYMDEMLKREQRKAMPGMDTMEKYMRNISKRPELANK